MEFLCRMAPYHSCSCSWNKQRRDRMRSCRGIGFGRETYFSQYLMLATPLKYFSGMVFQSEASRREPTYHLRSGISSSLFVETLSSRALFVEEIVVDVEVRFVGKGIQTGIRFRCLRLPPSSFRFLSSGISLLGSSIT